MKIFKSKILYIILIVIFTLILAGTLIIRFAVPSGRPSFGGDFTPPAGFSTDSEGRPSFEMPSDFSGEGDFTPPDFGGDGDFTPPEGFDRPDAKTEDNSSDDKDSSANDQDTAESSSSGRKRPSGSSSFPGRPGSSSSGFTGTIRSIWIPLVILSALGDAFSIFMLIRVSKKKGSGKDNGTGSSSSDDEDGSSKKPLLFLLVIPVLVLAIVLKLIPQKGSESSSVEVKEDLITAEAASKELKTVFLSGGSLSESDKISFTVPGDIEITSYAVSNGDSVKEGDLIATVNKTSVMNQISEIKDLIADLDDEIKNSREDDDYKTITSPASGRVMAIYAGKGVSVSDTIASKGALILLSLDGLMKVEIDKVDGLAVGDSVKVKLSDSTEKTGRVAQVAEDKITVTIADKKTTLGDKAEVLSTDGKSLGSGELQINSCLKITGTQGMVNKISVKTGEYVDAGDDLIKLASKVHTTDYTELTDQRNKLTEQMNKLFVIYESGSIKSEGTGIISGLDEDIPVEGKTEENVSLNSNLTDTAALLTSASVVSAVSTVYDLCLSAAPKTKEFTQPADNKTTKDTKTTKETKSTKEDKQTTDSKSTTDSKTTKDSSDKKTTQTQDQTKPSGTDKVNIQDPTQQQKGDQTRPSGNGFPSNVTMPDSAKAQATTQTTTEQTTVQQDQTTSDDDSAYSVEETEIYKILPTESMSIDISVDELDIINIKKGQDATVSLDALPGQSFEGKVTEIANEGTYDSGNTKYTVTVLIDRTEQMYSGMNAGIRIETEDPAEYLTVPVAAISDEGGKTYVYTSYDEENDVLTGLTEVETGRSDGEDVEIVSGIKSGDKVCYRYADTIEYNFVRKT